MTISLGIEVFLKEKLDFVKGKRVALLAHAASLNSKLESTVELFHNHKDIHLTLLYGPEHGMYGVAQDMEGVKSEKDPHTGVEVVSLYGHDVETLKPTKKDFSKFDVLVCDLQDVGSRYYTYIYTMALCMQRCGEQKKEVIILDRLNPINGVEIEGPMLKREFCSFVGLYPLPVRHGMTIGELAQYFNASEGFNCDLTVIPMKAWNREYYFDQTDLDFVPPSPNMPNLNTALVYPGMCLLEATNISEGRGTTKPFEWFGAPYIKAESLTDHLNKLKMAGCRFRPIHFKPGFQKFQNIVCQGSQIHITDRKNFKPFETGLKIIKMIHDLYPEQFSWRKKPYEFVREIPAIDLLTGGSEYRTIVEGDGDLADLLEQSTQQSNEFKKQRKSFLLYR